MFDTILFDLDGTLTNPYMGITNGLMYAMEKMGRYCPPREELVCFIGPPLYDSFRREFGMSEDEILEGIRLYREYYDAKGLYENELIDGARELLAVLKGMGRRVCLATSKPRASAEAILAHFGLTEYFDYIGAAKPDGSIRHKVDVIRLVLERTGANVNSCLMVGDTKYDIEGAHETGMKCAAVLVGFGSREDFREYKADFVAEKLIDIAELV